MDHKQREGDEVYFEGESAKTKRIFDPHLLQEPLSILPSRPPLVLRISDTVTAAMRGMQRERRGCVLVTEDGTPQTKLTGIFTERDVLFRIVDRGRNPATLELGEVMTSDPESLPRDASIAWVLNKMAVGGFRHVPAVDEEGRPVFVVSVRDIVSFLVEFFPRDILNLPPDYEAGKIRTREGA